MRGSRGLTAALGLVILLLGTAVAQEPTCPEQCQEACSKTCDEFNDTDCAARPWKFMQVCGWDRKRYTNECCAKCAGTEVRYYCSVPLALATFQDNVNPKLCTMWC